MEHRQPHVGCVTRPYQACHLLQANPQNPETVFFGAERQRHFTKSNYAISGGILYKIYGMQHVCMNQNLLYN